MTNPTDWRKNCLGFYPRTNLKRFNATAGLFDRVFASFADNRIGKRSTTIADRTVHATAILGQPRSGSVAADSESPFGHIASIRRLPN
jgi:hypothetical protein